MIAAVALTGIAIVYARKKRRQRIVVTIGEDVVGKLGRDKYLGGEVGKNGSIYCVPYVYFLSFTHMLTHTHTHTHVGVRPSTCFELIQRPRNVKQSDRFSRMSSRRV